MKKSGAVLYSFRRCPYAIRARLAIALAGISLELREVLLRDKPACMLALSPKGTVPVLQTADGTVLEESLDIMRWALPAQSPGEEAWALITANDEEFKPLLDRYKYAERYPAYSQAHYREQACGFLDILEARLTASRAGCLEGEVMILADLAILPFIRQFANVDPDWFSTAPYPAVQHWLQRWLNSPLFARVMHKYPPWQPGEPGQVFPPEA